MKKHLGIKSVKASTPPVPSTPSSSKSSKKRKAIDNDEDQDDWAAQLEQERLAGLNSPSAKLPRKKDEEKRLKRFRAKPPVSYNERLLRARTQRMFLIDRNRTTSKVDTHEEEVFDIAGTTGNVYQVTVSKVPSCTCPDNGKGNQCKHIIYVMVNILKAPPHLAYQLALLTTELTEIFANAPVTPQAGSEEAATSTDTGGKRKPIEGDCPVCVMEFDESDKSEDIIWCKAACGNNIHRHCFEQWAKSKPGEVKCVYCRTPWKGDEESVKKIMKGGKVGADGYVNVAGELGISGQRDMSTYHQPWVTGRYGGYGRGYSY
ncbi:hypothetical protein B0J14DRAFT_479942 [Halenospora varia]|nr:hypothetical protein B0J14DRAFT_479942 [Halenospora varia]